MEEALELEPRPRKRKRKWKKIVLIIVGVLVLFIVAGFLYVNHYLNKSLPEHEGTIQLPILEEDVTVTTDENGVPHIKATTDQDLYRSEEHTSELQSRGHLVCRLLLEKK